VVAGGIYLPFPVLFFTIVDHGFHSAKQSVWRPAPPCLGPLRGYVTGEKSEQKKRLNGASFQAPLLVPFLPSNFAFVINFNRTIFFSTFKSH
jgi:hypothetical protein